MLAAALVVLALAALAALPLVFIYNRLVVLKSRLENAFSQISVQLKRRHDLIPNIVETAKGYQKHEAETLQKVVEARNEAAARLRGARPGDAASMAALDQAERSLAAGFQGIRLQVESYPDLKADAVMIQLSEELVSTENRVAFARQAYNDAAAEYNIGKKSFPANLFADWFGHSTDAAMLSFEDEKDIRQAPKVSF